MKIDVTKEQQLIQSQRIKHVENETRGKNVVIIGLPGIETNKYDLELNLKELAEQVLSMELDNCLLGNIYRMGDRRKKQSNHA